MSSLIKFIKLWLPVIIWASLIFYLSNIPNLKTNLKYDFILRKIAHGLEYFILTFLLHRAFKGSFNINIFQLFIYPTTLSLLYAISDELHQSFILSRDASMQDVLIDAIGILGCYIVIKILAVKQRNRTLV